MLKSNKIPPTNWKKIGEVYCQNDEQPIFICLICLEKAECINTSFSTYDGSALWWHIKQQHISDDCETIDQISEEIKKFQTNEIKPDSNKKNAESTDLDLNQNKEYKLKLLEEFHNNLVRNSVNNDATTVTQNAANTFVKDEIETNIKSEYNENYTNKFANCNYYCDSETYTISDEDDDDEEDYEILGHLESADKNEITNYIKHNDMIEITDDEIDIDEQDQVNTRPNTPIITNEEQSIGEGVDVTQTKYIDMFPHIKCQNIEGNVLPNNNPLHSISGIPTPNSSPCESSTSKSNDESSNISEQIHENPQYNQKRIWPRNKFTSFRSVQCKICGVRTLNEINMLIHQRRVHDLAPNEKQYHQIEDLPQGQQKNQSENIYNPRPFQCKFCNRRYATENGLGRHQQIYHSSYSIFLTTQCELCHKRILKDKLQYHMRIHASEGYACNFCGVVYKQKYNLKNHIKNKHSNTNT